MYLWQHPEKYNPDKAKLSSWLSIIARSRAVDRYRRIAGRREISMEEIVMESLGYAGNSVADEDGCYMEQGYAVRGKPFFKKGCSRDEMRDMEMGTSIEAGTSAEKLRRCVEELDEKERELILRRYYYEQKPAEIAVAMELPKKQVENRLYYVRQKLKKRMEQREGDRV
ncbi:MAG: RNA polymerase sigma factor [Roseburia sp.]|nr:RNA polymerase sigma factor [Roseburia sp.]MCM1099089.1 RNA polymerase sigma factor [Ruminococcus flavefaciens]